mgnify:FL=1
MHTLPHLGYEYNALEPYIDEQTMRIHHTKHHQTYIDKLNATLEKHPELQSKSAEELIKDLNKIPEDIRTAVRNHGGGHVNHSFWWPLLKKDVKISNDFLKILEKNFGSFDKFKEQFSKAAMGVFGSGWAWLVLNNEKLEIMTTPNQDSPLNVGKIPLLGLDVWEHNYYIRWNANRAGFVEEFFNVINWKQVEKNYEKALKDSFSIV